MDREALEQFTRTELPALARTLTLFCGDPEVAEAVAERTLVRVWRRWDHPRAKGDLDAWSRRVGFNLARHQQPPPGSPLAGLTGLQRAVLVLRFYEGRTVADTAALLGVSEDDVRSAPPRDLRTITVPEPRRPVDVHAIAGRARRERLRFRLIAAAVGLVLLVALGLLSHSGRAHLTRPNRDSAPMWAPAAPRAARTGAAASPRLVDVAGYLRRPA